MIKRRIKNLIERPELDVGNILNLEAYPTARGLKNDKKD